MRHSPSVAIAIFSDDKKNEILLIKRRDVPVWVLPGGAVEKGEPPPQAAIRETQEETGFSVKIEQAIGEYLPINRLGRHTFLFTCKILDGKKCLTDETQDIAFFPLNKLPKAIPPPYLDWIKDAKEAIPGRYLTKKLTELSYRKTLQLIFFHPILSFRFFLSRLGFPLNSKSFFRSFTLLP